MDKEMIEAVYVANQIGLSTDALNRAGFNTASKFTLSEAIDFVQKRSVAYGRWPEDKATKAREYLAELMRKQSGNQNGAIPVANAIELPAQETPTNQDGNDESAKTAKPAFAFILFSWICLAIVIAHAALIWHSALIWGVSGMIGGGIIFLIQIAAVSISSVAEKNRTSEFALLFVCLIDIAAWFIHYPAFIQENSLINPITTGFACAFLCASSFTALYLYRDSKLD